MNVPVFQQEEVLRESEMMIPDCLRRLKTSYEELKALLVRVYDRLFCTQKINHCIGALSE